jgi:hypothetical protein
VQTREDCNTLLRNSVQKKKALLTLALKRYQLLQHVSTPLTLQSQKQGAFAEQFKVPGNSKVSQKAYAPIPGPKKRFGTSRCSIKITITVLIQAGSEQC